MTMFLCTEHSYYAAGCAKCRLDQRDMEKRAVVGADSEVYAYPACPRHGQLARSCSECEHERDLSDAICEKVVAQRWAKRWKAKARQQRAGENDLHELMAARRVVEAARNALKYPDSNCLGVYALDRAIAAYDAAVKETK